MTNIKTISGKPSGFSDKQAADLRETLEDAIREGEHVCLFWIGPVGTERNETSHFESRAVVQNQFPTFVLAMYRAVHEMVMGASWTKGG